MPWLLLPGLSRMPHRRWFPRLGRQRESLLGRSLLGRGQQRHRRDGLPGGQEALTETPEPPLSVRISFLCRDWDLTWRTWRRRAAPGQLVQAGIAGRNEFFSHLLTADFFC